MGIYFMSSNPHKIEEVTKILESKISVSPIPSEINEIQNKDITIIAIEKAREAFLKIRRPVLVDHTGLYIRDFGNLPGGLLKLFWDSLQEDNFSKIFSKLGTAEATAKTIVAFCDGKRIHTFEGQTKGHITHPPRGNSDFQWDRVFIPDNQTKTFAEMDLEEKNKFSMRKQALEKFISFWEKRYEVE